MNVPMADILNIQQVGDEPIMGAIEAGTDAAIEGNTSTAAPPIIDRPMTIVRRASSSRELIT